jgi:hypothetical protein
MQGRLEIAGLALASLLVLAFIASFLRGLGGPGPIAVTETLDVETAPAVEVPPVEGRIRVEVLNGSGRPGLARAVTDRLREAGFDVVYFGNARAADSSVVLARVADADGARAVAQRLAISKVREQPDSTLLLDVTVILGKDFAAGREEDG